MHKMQTEFDHNNNLQEIENLLVQRMKCEEELEEAFDMLIDMHRTRSLGNRSDEKYGKPRRIWYAANPNSYLERISHFSSEFAAALMDLFLEGRIEFFIHLIKSDEEVYWQLAGE